MPGKIEEVRVLTLSTGARNESLCCEGFLIENSSESAVIYFREKDADGADCTAENGFALGPGERLELPLCARELSLTASAAGEVRLLILG